MVRRITVMCTLPVEAVVLGIRINLIKERVTGALGLL